MSTGTTSVGRHLPRDSQLDRRRLSIRHTSWSDRAGMEHTTLKRWEEITREERFFTSILFHDIRADSDPIRSPLTGRLGLSPSTRILDIGYEVCFFRDAALVGLIGRVPRLEKLTFDLLFTLSERRIVIVEAKAQQAFDMKQLENLTLAKSLIEADKRWSLNAVSLAALHSSRYSPRLETTNHFGALFTWAVIAQLYPANRGIYEHADALYNDRARPAYE